jgi:cell division protein FtsB
MPIIVCAAVLALTYLGFSATQYVIHNYELRQNEASIRRDIQRLDRDHERLVAVRDYLNSDEYIQDVARRVLGLVRPGETLVVVSSTAPSPTVQPPASITQTPVAEWWKALFVQPAAAPTAAP